MYFGGKHIFVVLLMLIILPGCQIPSSSNVSEKSQPETKPEWQEISSGFRQKKMSISYDGHSYEALVLQLNNKLFQWDLHYSQTPKRLQEWFDELQPSLVLNGAFFTEEYVPTGYFIADGTVKNDKAYTDGNIGTVAFDGGKIRLQSSLPAVTGFQSFPLLLRPPNLATIDTDSEKIARRTILAQDKHGHTMVILFDTAPITLHDAAQVLLLAELNLDWALNLDGGPSTGAIAKDGEHQIHVLPAAELPIVISAKRVSEASPNGQ